MPSYNYRTASAAAVMDNDHDTGRGVFGSFVQRVLRGRPRDSIGIVAAVMASGTILVNALYLQPRAHPAPIFAAKPRPVATGDTTGALAPAAQPQPRPAAPDATTTNVPPAARPRTQIVMDIQRELARRGFYDGPVDGVHGPRTDTSIRDFEQAAGLRSHGEPDEVLLRTIARSTVKAPPAAAAAVAAPPMPVPAPKRPAAAAPPVAPSKRVLAVQRVLADYGYGQVAPTGIADAETKTAIERFERERKLPVTGQISERLTRELAAMTGRPLD